MQIGVGLDSEFARALTYNLRTCVLFACVTAPKVCTSMNKPIKENNVPRYS